MFDRAVRSKAVRHALLVAAMALVAGAGCLPHGRLDGVPGAVRDEPTPDGTAAPSPTGPVTTTAVATLTVPPTGTLPVTWTATAAATSVVTATPSVTGTPAISERTATALHAATPDVTPSPSRTPTVGPTASIQLPFAARNAVPPAGRPAVVWGAQFTFEEDAALHAADVQMELPRLKEAGVRSMRMHLRWRQVEPERRSPPVYDWSTADRVIGSYSNAGFDVVVSIVDYPAWAMVYRCGYGYRSPETADDWRAFVRAAAERYAHAPYRVEAWEIGNEVDGKTVVTDVDRTRPPEWGKDEPMPPQIGCWGDRPAAYLAFLKPAYGEIKAVDPTANVTFGNLAYATTEIFHRDFLDRFLALDSGPYFDFVGYHWFPELKDFFPDEPTGPEKYRMIADRLARRGLRKPIWITETYRRTKQGDADSERAQVEFLTESLPEVLACCPVARVYWFAWTDFAGQEAGQWQRGLVRSDHTPKLALPILRHTIAHTDGAATDISTSDTRAWEFRPPRSGVRTVIARRTDGGTGTLRVPALPGESATVTTFPDDALAQGRCCPQTRLAAGGGAWLVPVGPRAVFVRLVQR